MRWLLLPIGVLLACYQSDPVTGDVASDAPDVRDAADARDVPDVPPPDGSQCLTDDDCTVALHEDRCCSPSPRAVSRSELAADPCLRELGRVWDSTRHDECYVPCAFCGPIEDRFYAARCDAGRCVGVRDFCPPMVAPPSAGEYYVDHDPVDGWAALRGQVVTLRGWDTVGPDSCACCEECRCTCFDEPVQHTLNCGVTLRGSTCGTPWECTGTECDPACSPAFPLRVPLLEGYLVDTGAAEWELWPVVEPNECPPAGPNGVGEPCSVDVEGADDCEEGLVCFYWGDVIMGCDGECQPPGTECTLDTDCDAGEVCHLGYCVWCCPG